MRVLIIADVHANLEALDAILREAAGAFEELWCLGDIVGYGPEPRETLAELRRMRPVAVAGNHDRGVTGRLELDYFSEGARDALERHVPLLNADERAWLDDLPTVVHRESVTLCHGSLTDPIWDYILSPREAARTLELASTSIVFTGHTHVPAVWKQTGSQVAPEPFRYGETFSLREARFVINPGSAGQPRNGNPAAHYVLFDTGSRSVVFHQAPYPVRRTIQKMRRRGDPERSIARYAYGR